jgi:hypothetical protein
MGSKVGTNLSDNITTFFRAVVSESSNAPWRYQQSNFGVDETDSPESDGL